MKDSRIIEVTKMGTEEKLLINMGYVTNVFPTSSGGINYSDVYFSSGETLPVAENMEEIKGLLKKAL
tara:strand:+ start:1969 stop:2169 length:201 start_codon:yes stop_codon:yes gene_type:complete